MYDIKEVIDFFRTKERMTFSKMHSLLYFSYIYVLLDNESDTQCQIRLFESDINAGGMGPRITAFYELRDSGYFEDKQRESDDGYEYLITELEGDVLFSFDEETLDNLEQVWETFGNLDNWNLQSLCSDIPPWKEVRKAAGLAASIRSCKDNISDEALFDYYKRRYQRDDDTLDLSQDGESLINEVRTLLVLAMSTLAECNKEKYEKVIDMISRSLSLVR